MELSVNLYCKQCKKNFKNKGTLDSHLISKSHLKNMNFVNNKIKISDNKPIKQNNTYFEPCIISNFQEKLSKVLKRESDKKCIRKERMFKNTDSVNNALNELKQNHFENDRKDFHQKGGEIKINRAGDNLQKNILTSSRSSFVKSTLKP